MAKAAFFNQSRHATNAVTHMTATVSKFRWHNACSFLPTSFVFLSADPDGWLPRTFTGSHSSLQKAMSQNEISTGKYVAFLYILRRINLDDESSREHSVSRHHHFEFSFNSIFLGRSDPVEPFALSPWGRVMCFSMFEAIGPSAAIFFSFTAELL